MKTLSLVPLDAQAPSGAESLAAPSPVAFPPCQDPGHGIKASHIATAEAPAPDLATVRLDLLRRDIESEARRHWQRGEDADGMACWLQSAALKFAIRTLETRLAGILPAFTDSFDCARRVLWDAANEWAEVASLALAVPDAETNGSAVTNAAALRYAAQLLANETPASAAELAA